MRRLSVRRRWGFGWSWPLGGCLVAGAALAASLAVSVADGGDDTAATKVRVRPTIGDNLTAFRLRWRVPVRIGRDDELYYHLWGPGYVSEPGNSGCHGRLGAHWSPAAEAMRPGEVARMWVTIGEIPGAEERGWCPGRYHGQVILWKLKRSEGCPPEAYRDRCWRRVFIGTYQYTVKEEGEARPPMPVPRRPLLEYYSNGSPTLRPRGVSDVLWVARSGAALVRLYGVRGDPWRMACLGARERAELERLLNRAGRLDPERATRPYPRRGRQSLSFGPGGRHLIETSPAAWRGPMRGRLRRELFRVVDRIRVKTRRSERDTNCQRSGLRYGSVEGGEGETSD